ncbi:hypothetical protein JVU11DRAFT_4559 [Chiua virens]|nr:hypothetical protein JVU11DRAFT_4559 [Chiua virens]
MPTCFSRQVHGSLKFEILASFTVWRSINAYGPPPSLRLSTVTGIPFNPSNSNMISKHFVSLLALMATVPLSYGLPEKNSGEINIDVVYPKNTTKWRKGEMHHVVWKVSSHVKGNVESTELTLPVCNVYLAWYLSNGVELGDTLATNVSLAENRTLITIPKDARPGAYQIYLRNPDRVNVSYPSATFSIS